MQGYAYDAYRRTARLARGPWQDDELARRLDEKADKLYKRFNQVFWTKARGGFYHLALDRDKRAVDSKTSNMGHLLWSGIVPKERAATVAAQLMGPGLFSGWGIRTMSTEDGGFNPISYHCGTVWPHDNSIAVAGLHRYGFHDEANRVMQATIDAAAAFEDWEAARGLRRLFARHRALPGPISNRGEPPSMVGGGATADAARRTGTGARCSDESDQHRPSPSGRLQGARP